MVRSHEREKLQVKNVKNRCLEKCCLLLRIARIETFGTIPDYYKTYHCPTKLNCYCQKIPVLPPRIKLPKMATHICVISDVMHES